MSDALRFDSAKHVQRVLQETATDAHRESSLPEAIEAAIEAAAPASEFLQETRRGFPQRRADGNG